MATPMSLLLEEVSRNHFPYPPATPEEIDAFEQQMGWRLDPDLRAFYLHCNGAELFERLPDSPYQILPLPELVRARVAIFGKTRDDDAHGPASMYAICDVQDGDYVMLDVSRQVDGRYPLTDGWKEAWRNREYSWPVAPSFSDFLAEALRSNGRPFWLSQR